jgi:hypothetical protein
MVVEILLSARSKGEISKPLRTINGQQKEEVIPLIN